MLVLSRLKWDVAAVTPNDFVGPLLRRLSKFTLINEHQARIKKHVLNMIDLCSAGKCTLYSVIALYFTSQSSTFTGANQALLHFDSITRTIYPLCPHSCERYALPVRKVCS